MSEFNISVLIMRDNVIISGEIYTTGKNFTLPPAVTAVTNITSGSNDPFFKSHLDFHRKLNEYCRIENKQTNKLDRGQMNKLEVAGRKTTK